MSIVKAAAETPQCPASHTAPPHIKGRTHSGLHQEDLTMVLKGSWRKCQWWLGGDRRKVFFTFDGTFLVCHATGTHSIFPDKCFQGI